MREIKFRAWDKKNKKIICDYTKAIPTHYEGEKYDVKIGGGRNHMSIYVQNKCEEDCELLLYTGLKDKNGKEIYEGDIIATYTCAGDEMYRDVVKFGIGETDVNLIGFYLSKLEYLYTCLASGDVIILGNIYENPELLED